MTVSDFNRLASKQSSSHSSNAVYRYLKQLLRNSKCWDSRNNPSCVQNFPFPHRVKFSLCVVPLEQWNSSCKILGWTWPFKEDFGIPKTQWHLNDCTEYSGPGSAEDPVGYFAEDQDITESVQEMYPKCWKYACLYLRARSKAQWSQ